MAADRLSSLLYKGVLRLWIEERKESDGDVK